MIDITEVLNSVVDVATAKLLKSKGFNLPTAYYYQVIDLPFVKAGLKRNKSVDVLDNNAYDSWIYSAPTQQVAHDWLKEHPVP